MHQIYLAETKMGKYKTIENESNTQSFFRNYTHDHFKNPLCTNVSIYKVFWTACVTKKKCRFFKIIKTLQRVNEVISFYFFRKML